MSLITSGTCEAPVDWNLRMEFQGACGSRSCCVSEIYLNMRIDNKANKNKWLIHVNILTCKLVHTAPLHTLLVADLASESVDQNI